MVSTFQVCGEHLSGVGDIVRGEGGPTHPRHAHRVTLLAEHLPVRCGITMPLDVRRPKDALKKLLSDGGTVVGLAGPKDGHNPAALVKRPLAEAVVVLRA